MKLPSSRNLQPAGIAEGQRVSKDSSQALGEKKAVLKQGRKEKTRKPQLTAWGLGGFKYP